VIPDQDLLLGGESVTIDLASHFADPDNQLLLYKYTTNVTSVIDMELVEGSALQIFPSQAGTALVTVSAEDEFKAKAQLVFKVTVSPVTGTRDHPDNIHLQNHPNPFTGQTLFTYYLKKGGNVSLVIKDISGHVIDYLVNDYQTDGGKELIYDASSMANGFYLYHLMVDGKIAGTGKMLKN
jgi:hypothetical protein